MGKTVKKIFIILGVLVACFIGWQLVFNQGGILRTGYNAFVGVINNSFEKIAGDGAKIMNEWGGDGTKADTNGQAFDIDTEAK